MTNYCPSLPVFLHLSPYEPVPDPPLDDSETSLHYVPLSALLSPHPSWSFVTVDISSRLAPRHNILRTAVRLLVGNMRFRALVLRRDELEEVDDLYYAYAGQQRGIRDRRVGPANGVGEKDSYRRADNEDVEELKLWGLTLGMTLCVCSLPGLPICFD